jgi:hypothetical protein
MPPMTPAAEARVIALWDAGTETAAIAAAMGINDWRRQRDARL